MTTLMIMGSGVVGRAHGAGMSHNAAEREISDRSRDPTLLRWGVMSEENYMRIIDLRGRKLTRAEMLDAMPRAEMGTNEATELVQPILDLSLIHI